MRSSLTSLLRFLSSISLAACSSDGSSCGPDDAPTGPIHATAASVTLDYENLSSLSGNDCPDPAAPQGVISLSIEGMQMGGAGGRLTFCIPRPDLLDKGRALGSTAGMGEARVIDFSGMAGGCSFAYDSTMPPTGTMTATGICKNGTAKEGFALDISGMVTLRRTCGATIDSVTVMVTGKVAVTSRDNQ